MKNLVLIGMPGSGKSILGRLTALRLKHDFIDIDSLIEEREKKSITAIFDEYGEKAFRDLEASIVLEVSKKTDIVISTGGGVILKEENISNLKANGKIIFINRSLDNIVADLDISTRPLFQGKKEKLYAIYKDRIDLYKEYGDAEILNDTTINLVVEKILRQL